MADTFMGSIGCVDGCHILVYGQSEADVRNQMAHLDHEGATEWDVIKVVDKKERFGDFMSSFYDFLKTGMTGEFYAPGGKVPIKRFKLSDKPKNAGFRAAMWATLTQVYPELWD